MYFLFLTIIIVVIFSLDISWLGLIRNRGSNLYTRFAPNYVNGQGLYNSLIIRTNNGADLIDYKFYDNLVLEIEVCARKFGTPKSSSLLTIKKALIKDIEYEKKITNLTFSSFATFGAAALVTWLFSYYANEALGAKVSQFFVITAVSWQIVGILLFFIILKKLKYVLSSKFDKLFKSFYLMSLFSEVGMPLDTLLKSTKMDAIHRSNIKGIHTFQERISNLVLMRQKVGLSIKEELGQLIDEMWMLYAEHCRVLEKRVTLLKFVWLCVFFFSIYLASIFNILGSFGL